MNTYNDNKLRRFMVGRPACGVGVPGPAGEKMTRWGKKSPFFAQVFPPAVRNVGHRGTVGESKGHGSKGFDDGNDFPKGLGRGAKV